MAKEEKKYQVLSTMTKEGVRNIGVNLYFRKIFRKFWYIFVAEFIILCVPTLWLDASKIKIPEMYAYAMIVLLLLNIVWMYYVIIKKGSEFWNRVKDMPEPMDLRDVKW